MSTNSMQPEYLTKAYIIRVFDFEGKHSDFALVFSLPSEQILIFSNDKPKKIENRKISVRRFLRVLKRDGGMIRTQEPESLPLNLPHIYLRDEELKEILKDEYEKINVRINSRNNPRKRVVL